MILPSLPVYTRDFFQGIYITLVKKGIEMALLIGNCYSYDYNNLNFEFCVVFLWYRQSF